MPESEQQHGPRVTRGTSPPAAVTLAEREQGSGTEEFFHGLEFFAGYSHEALARFAASAEEATYQRGDMVFREDDDATALYLVRKGRVAIANRSNDDICGCAGGWRMEVCRLWSALDSSQRCLGSPNC